MDRHVIRIICVFALTIGMATSASALTYQCASVPDVTVLCAEISSGHDSRPISNADKHLFTFTMLTTTNSHAIKIYDADWVHIKMKGNKRLLAVPADDVSVNRYSPVYLAFNHRKGGADENRTKREHYQMFFPIPVNNLSITRYSPIPFHFGSNHRKVGDDGTLISRVNETASVPEPTSMLLLGFGLIGLAGVRRFSR